MTQPIFHRARSLQEDARRRRNLRQVHVPFDTGLSRVPQQSQEIAAFSLAAPPPNQNYQARVWLIRDERKEIVAIAGDEEKLVIEGEA
jgi:hypothetical protein